MGILTEEMKRAVAEQRLIFAATVCPDGTPNLSPKGTVMAWDDDHLLFTDLASPGTMANLESNPAIELNVVDVFLRKGYRFKGVATIHRDGEVFGAVVKRMRNGAPSLRGLAERVRAVALVRVETASTLVSPGYWGGATEPEMRRDWESYWQGVADTFRASMPGDPDALGDKA